MKIFSVSYQVVGPDVDGQQGRRHQLQRVVVVADDSTDVIQVMQSNADLDYGERIDILSVQHEHPGRAVIVEPSRWDMQAATSCAPFDPTQGEANCDPIRYRLAGPAEVMAMLNSHPDPDFDPEPATAMAEITAPEHGE